MYLVFFLSFFKPWECYTGKAFRLYTQISIINSAVSALSRSIKFIHTHSVRPFISGLLATDPSKKNFDGIALLHVAVMKNFPEVVEILLEAGASISAACNMTPLSIAAHYGHYKCSCVTAQPSHNRMNRNSVHWFSGR